MLPTPHQCNYTFLCLGIRNIYQCNMLHFKIKLQYGMVPYFVESADSVAGLDTPSSINTWILAITASSKYRSDSCGRLDLGTRESTHERKIKTGMY